MIVMGIDPGPKESGYVTWVSGVNGNVLSDYGNSDNESLLRGVLRLMPTEYILAIEQIRGYGIVAGDDTFDTCQWSGRFQEAFESRGGIVKMVPRKDIKRFLCGNTTTNDKYIRQALIDRLGDVGTKKHPGPLYGVSGHLWAALAVAVYVTENASWGK